ncbi:MAG: alpha/beta fold hydrolase [Thermodesulfobacteriota bacterium]
MNRYAYRTTGLVIKTLSGLIKPKVKIHDQNKIPADHSLIFVVNHFTRAETLLVPYYINKITGRSIWSLASQDLFKGGLGSFLEKLGAVSTGDPDRDKLIVKTLLTNEASWVIFPEGRMVKNKKIYDVVDQKGQFIVSSSAGKHPPHTGAATLALRTEFYRSRIERMVENLPDEARRLLDLFEIDTPETIRGKKTLLVPVNLTYYPIRAKENIVSNLAGRLFENLSSRALEELQTEGTLLLSDTDIDIRFGEPIDVTPYLDSPLIRENIELQARIDFNDSIAAKQVLRDTAVQIMERYMSAIYNMTTVNHDHIFASLLKYIPEERIPEDDLKRRAYLAIDKIDSLATRTFKHTSLQQDQTHLLTDDRHHKYANFIAIAEETGAVKKADGFLTKTENMSLPPDFHSARVTNPITVIANEVEPLSDFQEAVRELAAPTCETIQKKVTAHLIAGDTSDFENDYAQYAIPGESKDKNVGRPFLLKSPSPRTGVVLVHGYMAAPMEVRALADYLNSLDITVYVPRLRGHGTSPVDLARRLYAEWIESVEKGYAIVKNSCDRVIAGGFSMGAGLVLDLAARVNDDLAGIFAVAPPLKLQNFSSNFVPAVNLWNRLLKRINVDKNRVEFIENTPENPHINYSRNPLAGISEMGRLMDTLESRLPAITVPALILQSQADPVVNSKGSRMIFEKLSSTDKEYLLVNYNRHGIINGEGSDRVFRAIGEFVRKIMVD